MKGVERRLRRLRARAEAGWLRNAVPSEILRRSTLLLSNTKPRKLPRYRMCTATQTIVLKKYRRAAVSCGGWLAEIQ